jgi:YgiT-type zinc finger domain-containing protein
MMCVYCGGGLVPDKTDYIEKVDNHIILIRDVPCEKCKQCGETFFDNKTVLEIEEMLNKIQHISSEITLTVLDYSKNVA